MKGWGVICCLFLCAAAAAADEIPGFRLEGVMLDEQTPGDSIAMINGQALRPGDTIDGFHVQKVESGAAFLAPDSGGPAVRLEVSAAPPAPDPVAIPVAVSAPASWQERLKDWWEHLFAVEGDSAPGPAAGLDLWERAAVTDLTQIYMAGVGYFESRQAPAQSFADMVHAGLLPDRYQDGTYGKYRYQLKWRGHAPEVQADAVEAGRGYRSFYIDSEARIRVAPSGPAGPESPLLN